MNFLYPQILILLVLAPLYLYYIYKKEKGALLVTTLDDLRKAQSSKREKILKHAKNIVVAFIIVFFVITLARPQSVHERDNISKKGIDIILAMDVSGSMLAEDLKPDRISAAKEALKKFITYLENDRLGIVVFSGAAFTQSPLTFDYAVLDEYVEGISIDSISQNISGTAIGDAILAAVNRFKKSEDRTKVLVILTDGDANTGVDPEMAAKKAKQENVIIYTIGIGKEGGAPLPQRDAFGNKTYARNRDGSLAMATFNEEALRKIARIGDGQYFRADDNKSFDEAMKEISFLQKREIKTQVITEYNERFYFFLATLFFLFIVYNILNIRFIKK
jgi:Ca-activated chloride channel homolog